MILYIKSHLIKSIDIAEKETWRREAVIKNSSYLREKLLELGTNIGSSETQIIPVIVGDEKKAAEASRILLENNIFIPAATWPAVPKKHARLRITVTCANTKEQIDILVENIKKIKSQLKF